MLTDTPPLAVLPPNPRRLSPRYYARRAGLVAFLTTITALLGALTTWIVRDVPAVWDDQRVWEAGLPAVRGDAGGEVQSVLIGWLMSAYTLEVRYQDAAGAWHEDDHHFFTMFGALDTDRAPEIRYDPAEPARFTTSWEVEAAGARIRGAVFLGLFFGAITLLLASVTFDELRRVTPERACAAGGVEHIGLVRQPPTPQTREGKPTKTWTLTVGVRTSDGGETTHVFEFPEGNPPLYLDARQDTVLTVRSPGGPAAVVLVLADFYPFSLSKAQADAANHRVQVLRREAWEGKA